MEIRMAPLPTISGPEKGIFRMISQILPGIIPTSANRLPSEGREQETKATFCRSGMLISAGNFPYLE
jgi:hypothetical protein